MLFSHERIAASFCLTIITKEILINMSTLKRIAVDVRILLFHWQG